MANVYIKKMLKKSESSKLYTDTSKKSIKIIDLLKGSTLPKGVVIKDILKWGCDVRRIEALGVALPRRTMESYYQQLADGNLDFTPSSSLNEILPLLFLSLNPDPSLASLESFPSLDPEHSLLDPTLASQLAFVCQCYV